MIFWDALQKMSGEDNHGIHAYCRIDNHVDLLIREGKDSGPMIFYS
jgi:hypothetical protein